MYKEGIAIWLQQRTKGAFVSSSASAGLPHPCRGSPEPPVLAVAGVCAPFVPQPRPRHGARAPFTRRRGNGHARRTPSRAAVAAHAAPCARAPPAAETGPGAGAAGGRLQPLGGPRAPRCRGARWEWESRAVQHWWEQSGTGTRFPAHSASRGDGALPAPPLGSCSLCGSPGRAGGSDEDCASRRAARPHCGHARSSLAAGRGRASLPARWHKAGPRWRRRAQGARTAGTRRRRGRPRSRSWAGASAACTPPSTRTRRRCRAPGARRTSTTTSASRRATCASTTKVPGWGGGAGFGLGPERDGPGVALGSAAPRGPPGAGWAGSGSGGPGAGAPWPVWGRAAPSSGRGALAWPEAPAGLLGPGCLGSGTEVLGSRGLSPAVCVALYNAVRCRSPGPGAARPAVYSGILLKTQPGGRMASTCRLTGALAPRVYPK